MSLELAIQKLENYYPDSHMIIIDRIFEHETEYEYCFEAYVEGTDKGDTACYWLVSKDLSGIGVLLE